MWTTPKTDWYGVFEDGVYKGDRFNAVDFNRIKNNLEHLRDLAQTMYEEFSIHSLGQDRTPKVFFQLIDFIGVEEILVTITSNTIKRSYGSAPVYADNGNTMDFEELNRLESAILDLYNRLTNQSEGRRMLTWNFGAKEGF